MTTVTEENTEPTAETTEESAESATPPSVDGDSTETTKAKVKRTPKTYKERLDAAVEKGSIVHQAFVDMVKRETGREIELDSVIATFSLYNDWRASDAQDYKDAKAAAAAASPAKTPKAAKQPKTADEATAELAKLQERMAEIEKIKAQLLAAQTGEEATASETESTTENAAEATETGDDKPPF